jgi:ribose transport system permease protein
MTEQQTSIVTEAAATQRATAAVRTSPRWRPRLATWAPLLVLVLVCVLIALINPRFLTLGNFVRIAQAAMIPLVLGLGATFVILMGSIDLSVEGVVALGAVLTSLLVLNGGNANDLGLAGLVLVVLTGAAVGLVNGVVHVRLRVPSFMTTLGTWFVAAGVANALLGGIAVRINDAMVRGLVLERFLGLPWGVWLALAALGVAYLIQDHTRLGRYMYALGGGEELAALSGIKIARVRIAVFTVAGAFYAIGGILSAAQLGLGNAQVGQGRLFTTVTAVVVGGTALSGGEGSVLQTLVGVLIVTVLANGMVLMGISPSIQTAVQGLMIIVAVALSIDRERLRIVK